MIVQIIRAFVELRRLVKENIEITEIKSKVKSIEQRQDQESQAIWKAIDFNRKEIGKMISKEKTIKKGRGR
jgi:predicted metal-binding protein